MQRAPSDAESSTFLGCRRQIRRISNTSCRKSFLKLRSDWAGCRFPPKLWANPACGLCMARQLGPRCACRPSHWPWPPALAQGCPCLPSMSQAWAITPRAPSADRLCASERREQKTRWHSLSLEVSMAAARSKVGRLQPGCPRIALASCPARRYAQTNRPPVRAQTMSGISQTAGAFCSSGGEGSWPALGGQLACS